MLENKYDNFYIGYYFKLSFTPLYFLTVLLTFYLKDVLYEKRKYFLFFLVVLFTCVVSSYIMHILFKYVERPAQNFFIYLIGTVIMVSTACFIRFIKQQLSLEIEWKEFRFKQNEAELKLLKQQLNPHFLFNTLNSIYAGCLENKKDTANMVLQLSDMLRYQLETHDLQTILLRDELSFIENYIYFESRRLSPVVQLDFKKHIEDDSIKLLPNVLIILIENAFKHCNKLSTACQITIEINSGKKEIEVSTKNTYNPNYQPDSTQIGIENLKKRLEYTYPGRYSLDINKDGTYFYASLKLRL